MNNEKHTPITTVEMISLKNDLEIEYSNTTNDLDKRAIHVQIECLDQMLKVRKTLKEVDDLLLTSI